MKPQTTAKVITDPTRLELLKNNYAFGNACPDVARWEFRDVGTITSGGKSVDVVSIYDPDFVEGVDFTISPKNGFALEGVCAIGKTSILKELNIPAESDLQELRSSPYGVLSGIGEDFGHFKEVLRSSMYEQHKIVDRSDWVAPLVYGAYYSGVLFLFDNTHIQKFILSSTPYETLVVDDDSVTDQEIWDRMKNRQGMDSNFPLEYISLQRQLFKIVAQFYGLQIVTPKEAMELIKNKIY